MSRRGPQTAEEAHAEAVALGARCEECPLYGTRQGPVMGEPGRLSLIAIGKGPGVDEVDAGRAHIGPASIEIRRILGKGHLTNAWLCRSPPPAGDDMDMFVRRLRLADRQKQKAENRRAKREGRKPKKLPQTPTPAQCCAPRLRREIEDSGASVVITLGRDALKSVAQIYGIPIGKTKEERPDKIRIPGLKAQMGHPLRIEAGAVYAPEHLIQYSQKAVGFTLYPTMHPAAAAEGRGMPHMREPILDNMKEARRLAKQKGRWKEPKADELILPPEKWSKAFFRTVRDWARREAAAGRPVLTVDVETD